MRHHRQASNGAEAYAIHRRYVDAEIMSSGIRRRNRSINGEKTNASEIRLKIQRRSWPASRRSGSVRGDGGVRVG